MDATEVRDPYEVLKLPNGADSTEQEIKKAYRLLVLKVHPDKNPDDPNAAKVFNEVQQAYDIALDPKAREAWMQLKQAKQAREARWSGQSAKRQKMMDELNKREATAARERSSEDLARSRLQAELARLRKQHAERAAARAQDILADLAQGAAQATAASPRGSPAPAAGLSETELMRTIKASWERCGEDYSTDALRQIFGVHGEVTDIVHVQPKKRAKGSALVQFAALQPALSAAQAAHGRPDNPIKVTPFVKALGDPAAQALAGGQAPRSAASTPAAEDGHTPHHSPLRAAPPSPAPSTRAPPAPSQHPPEGPSSRRPPSSSSMPAPGQAQARSAPTPHSFPGPQVPVFGAANRDFESLTLMRMRQKAERDRLAAELLQQE